jgi:transcription elongation factor Elf1
MDEPGESSEIRDTDIVFDCPNCGKSLAIDYRGAGLTIPCTDCGKHVQVPIPEGMEISDVDSSKEDQENLVLNLRKSLAAAERRIVELENRVDELEQRRLFLEKSRADNIMRFGVVMDKASQVRESLSAMEAVLRGVAEETQDGKPQSPDAAR